MKGPGNPSQEASQEEGKGDNWAEGRGREHFVRADAHPDKVAGRDAVYKLTRREATTISKSGARQAEDEQG